MVLSGLVQETMTKKLSYQMFIHISDQIMMQFKRYKLYLLEALVFFLHKIGSLENMENGCAFFLCTTSHLLMLTSLSQVFLFLEGENTKQQNT